MIMGFSIAQLIVSEAPEQNVLYISIFRLYLRWVATLEAPAAPAIGRTRLNLIFPPAPQGPQPKPKPSLVPS